MSSRGQTLPDFVVGIAIFLITVTLVVQFIPQLVLPYEGQERPLVAQRVANDLSGDLLAAESPSTLNETCTVAFFEQSGGSGCPFNTSESLSTQLGIDSAYAVNATLRDGPSDAPGSARLCAVGGDVESCASGGTPLAVGSPTPPADESIATARRRVRVGDTDAVLEIEVW